MLRAGAPSALAPYEAVTVISDVHVRIIDCMAWLPRAALPLFVQDDMEHAHTSAMQASIFGDDFWQFVDSMGGGALQRCGIAAWLDVFCTHKPEDARQVGSVPVDAGSLNRSPACGFSCDSSC